MTTYTDPHALGKDLIGEGIHVQRRLEITRAARVQNKKTHRTRIKNDWKALLTPLKRHIVCLQSGKKRWSADPLRGPIYAKYLQLLLATRERIQNVNGLNFGGLSIPAVAAREKGTCGDGLRWQDWIPAEKQRIVQVVFQTLYNTLIPAAHKAAGRLSLNRYGTPNIGKRIVPFRDDTPLTTDEIRWGLWQAELSAMLHKCEVSTPDPIYESLLRAALSRVYSHADDEPCKVMVARGEWVKFLTPEQHEQYRVWAIPNEAHRTLSKKSEAQARWRAKKKEEAQQPTYPMTRAEKIEEMRAQGMDVSHYDAQKATILVPDETKSYVFDEADFK